MTTDASEEQIAAAAAYEDLHVPALFRQWASRVAEAADIRAGHRVLDVACGTGVLAREAARRVGERGFVEGLDPDPGMLAVARRAAPWVAWQEGVAELLPYHDRTYDAVVSQFGLMFFEGRIAALREMLRVLKPGGRLVVAVWESLENSEAYPIEVELLERLAGQPAANALRAPFVLGDQEELRALFVSAGAGSIDITTHTGRARFPSVRTMVSADLRGWLPVMGVLLSDKQIETILDEAEEALDEYVTADGMIEFDAPAHIVTATR